MWTRILAQGIIRLRHRNHQTFRGIERRLPDHELSSHVAESPKHIILDDELPTRKQSSGAHVRDASALLDDVRERPKAHIAIEDTEGEEAACICLGEHLAGRYVCHRGPHESLALSNVSFDERGSNEERSCQVPPKTGSAGAGSQLWTHTLLLDYLSE